MAAGLAGHSGRNAKHGVTRIQDVSYLHFRVTAQAFGNCIHRRGTWKNWSMYRLLGNVGWEIIDLGLANIKFHPQMSFALLLTMT